jgi:hypothetical protein
MATYDDSDAEGISTEVSIAMHHLRIGNAGAWEHFLERHAPRGIRSELDVLVFALGCAVTALCGATTSTASTASADTVVALATRVKALEEAGGHHGVWQSTVRYRAQSRVTHAGSEWVARSDNISMRPGVDGSPWQLSTKRGKDGRDGRDAVPSAELADLKARIVALEARAGVTQS